ncbi:MAG: hypothetical protein JXN59_03510, partial [Anaerolineae bacterium]|nr:hypothetical protein [Anaerolineae bacterium]
GYLASVLVAISLMMRSVLRLRLINLIGSAVFTGYGLLIGALPIALLNFLVVLINLYNLAQMLKAKEYFELLEVAPQSRYLQRFLRFYAEDIRQLMPDFAYDPEGTDVAFLVLRNMVPAGVFLARRGEDGSLLVTLDYVIPGYRDLKTARFVYGENSAYFVDQGIRQVYSLPGSARHRDYLRRMGFRLANSSTYVKSLG